MHSVPHTIRGCCQLTSSSKAIGHKPFKEHRVQVSACQINRGRVSSRTRAYDDLQHTTNSANQRPATEDQIKRVIRTTLECIFELLSGPAGSVGAILDELRWCIADDTRGIDAQLLGNVGLKNVRDSVVKI